MRHLAVMFSLGQHAVTTNIIKCLTERQAASSVSLFSNDVVIFCHPDTSELSTVSDILDLFGSVFGLRTNFTKSLAASIQCPDDMSDAVGAALACPIVAFLIQYLGLPLSLRKVPASQLQSIVDKLLRKLAT